MILAFFCTAEISFLCTDYIGYLFHNVRMIFCCLLVFCHLAHGLPLRHSFEFNCHAKMDRHYKELDSMELTFLELTVFLFHLSLLAGRSVDSPEYLRVHLIT